MSATYPEAIPVTLAASGEKVSGNDRDPVAIQCTGGKFESIKARFKFYPQKETAAWSGYFRPRGKALSDGAAESVNLFSRKAPYSS